MTTLATVLFTVSATGAISQDSAFSLHGTGDQAYRCENIDGGFARRFAGSEAVLRDADGLVAIRHSVGRHWTASDGSTVYGTVVTTIPAPDLGAITWLVLRASRHEDAGLLNHVAFVLQTDTQDGLSPSSSCGEQGVNAEVRSHYKATDTFVSALPSAQANHR